MKRLAVGSRRRIPSSSITTNSTKAAILRRGSSRISWFKRCELRSNRSASKQHNRRAPPTGECLISFVNQRRKEDGNCTASSKQQQRDQPGECREGRYEA